MSANQPIVNLGLLYVNNMQFTYTSDTTITLAAGQCRDSTNVTDIAVTSGVVLDAAINGANGLDTGSLAASTWYAIHAIGSSGYLKPGAYILSTSATAPLLPSGYDVFRRIGWVKTDGSAHIAKWETLGNFETRTYFWPTTALLLNAQGNANTFAALDLSSAVPSTARQVFINWSLVPNTAANLATFRETGNTAGAPNLFVSAPVAAKASAGQIMVLTNTAQNIDWKTSEASDALSLYVTGYVDLI